MPTKIEWCDETWNPLIGCSRCSPGCDHCYAIGVVHRGMSAQHVGLTVKPDDGPTDWTGEVRPVPHLFDQPTRWKRPRRIFVNSLSDLFHQDVPDELIETIVGEMAANTRHTFQVLTKRPQRMASWLETVYPQGWNLSNVWWGASIESDRYTFRADHLRRISALGLRSWISAEPLLSGLPSLDLTGISWVVAGGESGPGARPMHPGWARDLRDRCVGHVEHATADLGGGAETIEARLTSRPVAFLFKQWGNWLPGGQTPTDQPESVVLDGLHHAAGCRLMLDGEVVDLDSRVAESHLLRNVGKKLAGRELDGRTWDEYPG